MNRKALAAEFLGTFGLVFAFVGVNCAGAAGGNPAVTLALGYGLAYMVFSAGVFHVSGGHLNPAVTFAALLTGRLQVHEALAYVAAQCVGAVAAAALMVHALPPEMLSAGSFGLPALGANVSLLNGFLVEFVFTFLMILVIFGTQFDERSTSSSPVFSGLAIAVGVLTCAPLSGGAFNPAIHLGPAIFSWSPELVWLYWLAPLAGAGLAALVYSRFLAEDPLIYRIEI